MDNNLKIAKRFLCEIFAPNWNFNLLDIIIHENYKMGDFVSSGIPYDELMGIEALTLRLKKYKTAFPDMAFQIIEHISQYNKVAIFWNVRMTQKGFWLGIPPTNLVANYHGCHYFKFRDGKITETSPIFDSFKLLSEIGNAILKENEEDKVKQYLDSLKEMNLIPK